MTERNTMLGQLRRWLDRLIARPPKEGSWQCDDAKDDDIHLIL